jgi:hypothetical protein
MSASTIYSLRDGLITVTDAAGQLLWAGRPLGVSVKAIAALSTLDAVIVLLDYMEMGRGQVKNLIRLERDGRVAWQASLPTREPSDCYVDFSLGSGSHISASSWSGWRVLLDPASGEIEEKAFTK